MRIRKNAKLIVTGGRTSSSFLICQLNRSPWDIDSFFTPGDWDNDDLPINGRLNESIPSSNSIPSGQSSMELSFEYVGKTTSQSEMASPGSIAEAGGNVNPVAVPPREGERDCIMSFSPAPLPSKKVVTVPSPTSIIPKKRGRPKKFTTRTGANNNSYSNNGNGNGNDDNSKLYYYSGFGPSWGKRRRGSNKSAPQKGNGNEIGNGNSDSEQDACDDMYDDNDISNSNSNGMVTPGCSSTTRDSSMSNDNDDNLDDGEKKSKGDDSNDGIVIQSFESILAAEQELDYIGDEEDEELYGGKLVRKPIKARSLKSLM